MLIIGPLLLLLLWVLLKTRWWVNSPDWVLGLSKFASVVFFTSHNLVELLWLRGFSRVKRLYIILYCILVLITNALYRVLYFLFLHIQAQKWHLELIVVGLWSFLILLIELMMLLIHWDERLWIQSAYHVCILISRWLWWILLLRNGM
jgi:hypothetical protein